MFDLILKIDVYPMVHNNSVSITISNKDLKRAKIVENKASWGHILLVSKNETSVTRTLYIQSAINGM